ncbi:MULTISPECIES: phage terminase small subunit [Rodentibacter]|uniref:phage terminase small subunit n=1 Tax=Rodentibacter TaxID=1960084 RepID=UPI001CFD6161|nr:phage terminase small subunit [Rodentibacter sp. JRC1]GJI55915.1 terminase endonuclease subunit [Rodentibacter sp. JRC1]
MRPTKRHFIEVSSALANAHETEDLSQFSEYEKMLRLLARHKKDLKQIQSTARKADFKKRILPDYLPWIEGALSAGTGKQDNVLMTWCVWAIDCGEYHLALTIADYAIFHDLQLPEPFTRTLGTMVAEEFADQAKAATAANQPFETAYLEQVQRLTADCDMPDESRARLLRELGLLTIEKNPTQALEYLERAIVLDQKVGVKGEIKKLRKQLEKENTES